MSSPTYFRGTGPFESSSLICLCSAWAWQAKVNVPLEMISDALSAYCGSLNSSTALPKKSELHFLHQVTCGAYSRSRGLTALALDPPARHSIKRELCSLSIPPHKFSNELCPLVLSGFKGSRELCLRILFIKTLIWLAKVNAS